MPRISRTYGPIHFEDLEPHRFEDLIRELVYEFKDWQSIEATGRGSLPPVYDPNPVPTYLKAGVLTTNIDLDEGTCSLDLLEALSEYFGLNAGAGSWDHRRGRDRDRNLARYSQDGRCPLFRDQPYG
ncbi:protein of unknown function [Bradyrhizobium sp. ORS 285]|nr:hypothetical protein BRAO285_180012 [Bradyrhizobium sp. ORS 285]SMX61028.1 protein of unknown function [Bradyrhizobium sp. ORS 285]